MQNTHTSQKPYIILACFYNTWHIKYNAKQILCFTWQNGYDGIWLTKRVISNCLLERGSIQSASWLAVEKINRK